MTTNGSYSTHTNHSPIDWAKSLETSAAGAGTRGTGPARVVSTDTRPSHVGPANGRTGLRPPVMVEVTPERLSPSSESRPDYLRPLVAVIAAFSPSSASQVMTNEAAWRTVVELKNRAYLAGKDVLGDSTPTFAINPGLDRTSLVDHALSFADETDRERVLADEVRRLRAENSSLRAAASGFATALEVARGLGPIDYTRKAVEYTARTSTRWEG